MISSTVAGTWRASAAARASTTATATAIFAAPIDPLQTQVARRQPRCFREPASPVCR
jgi:hypothetical protein